MNPACECGCGAQVGLTREGRLNRFIRGHSRRGQPVSPEHRRKLSAARLGQPGPWLGKKMPLEARQKMSAAKKGKPLRPAHRLKISRAMIGKPHPSVHHKQSLETRMKKSLALRGDKGPRWKGGVSTEHALARSSFEFREWRLAVMRRDRWTCRKCGAKHRKGFRPALHAHHVKPFATHQELRFDVDNGLTLCKPCHDEIHGLVPKMGYYNPKRVQQHH